MNCKDCKYWNLSKKARNYFKSADCYRVIGYLKSELFDETNSRGYKFTIPFDPYTMGDFDCSPQFNDLVKEVIKELPQGMTVDIVDGNYYFKTKEDFTCKYFEPL